MCVSFFSYKDLSQGPKTQGYIIATASEADFHSNEHEVRWRDRQLTTKMSWVGSLEGTQVFATVQRNTNQGLIVYFYFNFFFDLFCKYYFFKGITNQKLKLFKALKHISSLTVDFYTQING